MYHTPGSQQLGEKGENAKYVQGINIKNYFQHVQCTLYNVQICKFCLTKFVSFYSSFEETMHPKLKQRKKIFFLLYALELAEIIKTKENK